MLSVLGVIVLLAGAALSQNTTLNNVEAELTQRGEFTIFLDFLRQFNLLDSLNTANKLTLFAPTDHAFNGIPQATFDALKQNHAVLNGLLQYHIIYNKSMNFKNDDQDTVVTSSNGFPIRINVYRLLHIYAAEGVNMTERNIHISNGRLHVLDGVMGPPMGNIAEIAGKRGDINTLAGLAVAAGIVTDVLSDMNLTMFAPNDAAFTKVSPDVMAYLNANPTTALKETLMYHFILDQTLYSIGMKHTLTYHSGDDHKDNLMILQDESGGIMVNDAHIIDRDISAMNGVIHVIDHVLIPARVLLEMETHGIVVVG